MDAIVADGLDASYHDGKGGWDATGVRWWIKFHLTRGEDPFTVAGPEASLEDKLNDEWRLMRFMSWLVELKKPSVNPTTADGYASTVQGWLARNFGVKLGAGIALHRRKELIKGLTRLRGGNNPKKLRKALTPDKLARAFQHLNPNNPLHANVRAALASMLQGLLRAGEAVQSDKAKNWNPSAELTRGDIVIGSTAMELMIVAEKDATTLGSKSTPIVIGRGGRHIDAVAEMENLRRVDPTPAGRESSTPAFRDPRTGKPFKVADMNEWVQTLMSLIGEDGSEYGSHSCRIGGATAMFAAGCSALDIRTMGRWSSDIYLIYVHSDRARAAEVTRRLASTTVKPTEDPFDEVDDY